ncbi:MAG: response regulator [bacterium]|nr:response regulator [bacterium]
MQNQKPTLLMAEDDADDQLLVREAFGESDFDVDMRFVCNGEDLMAYLRREGEYCGEDAAPRPRLILLDLNMPKMDGRTALRAIKENPDLCRIPVLILTTSSNPDDIKKCYEGGASTYLTKPSSFQSLIELANTLGGYWFNTATLPNSNGLH